MERKRVDYVPKCENCDLYVDIRTLNPRKKKGGMVCKVVMDHMNPLLHGCQLHPAYRKPGVLEKMGVSL
jgi:hypothetical protein